ncbi:MAG: hypothetical protein HYV63_18990, partial [Candidatus Schekmanbacteria bacterium]|nr:hypothetical protein [Candidatus Schekmanbacteria bacterium]
MMRLMRSVFETVAVTSCVALLAAVPARAERGAPAAPSAITFDLTDLSKTPADVAPAVALKREAFQATNLAKQILETDQTFTAIGKLRNREQLESTDWYMELDNLKGHALLISKNPDGAP